MGEGRAGEGYWFFLGVEGYLLLLFDWGLNGGVCVCAWREWSVLERREGVPVKRNGFVSLYCCGC
jgi:hypothetical protein